MNRPRPLRLLLLSSLALAPLAPAPRAAAAQPSPAAEPLVIGETFTMRSAALGELRRINVYFPPYAAPSRERPLPVLYMPDGGIAEDFLHVAGLVQVSAGNGTMRPFLLVGIENTERRRDMTGPTTREDDRKIAPRVGGSAAFRRFIREELIPEVERRYAVTRERAIVGESLAGLFVVETFLTEPELFDTYIAFDPSLWWNGERLVADAAAMPGARGAKGRALWIATSGDAELGDAVTRLGRALEGARAGGLRFHHEPMPRERHATIYHPAALQAFRALLAPAPAAAEGSR